MKKLMIAAAIVCAAAFAEASAIQWQVATQSWLLQDGSKPNGATVYLVNTDAADYDAMVSAIAAGTTFDVTAWDAAIGSATSFVPNPGLPEIAKQNALNMNYGQVAVNPLDLGDEGDAMKGNTYNFAYLVFDSNASGDYYAISATAEGMPYVGSSADGSTANFGATAFTNTANGATGWVSIAPEPTSGLLLLLGVAGLALRRRRA